MDVTITTQDGTTTLTAPYNPAMPAEARKLGGRFDRTAKAWRFDARDEGRVRDLARRIYGTDGDTAVELVTVRLDVDAYTGGDPQSVFLAGRQIAHRPARDLPVRLGEGVIVIEGGFPGRGGSVKNPRLVCTDGTILEIRDVPRPAAEAEAEQCDGVTIVDTQGPDVDALLAERERLLARLAEIDAQLPEPEGAEASTREAAQALGVSVRTVQRWAASGEVEARKDERGRWVVTITVGR